MADRVEKVPGRAGREKRVMRVRHSEKEIRALISLLADDDEKIVGMVWENLLRLREVALPYLYEVIEHADARMRLRARHVASRIHAEVLEQRFRDLAARDDASFDLEEALCVVARIEYPDLDQAEISLQLEEMADALRPRIPTVALPREKVDLLNRYLFQELGFRGNRKDYYDPDNTYINKVLERRIGIPISLSAVTILLGRRLGLPLYGVGLPKHFLVKYRDASTEIFIDPFSGGRVLSRTECTEILTSEGYFVRESFVAEYLAVSAPRDMIIRMLRSLVLLYSKKKNRPRSKCLTQYVDILRMRH